MKYLCIGDIHSTFYKLVQLEQYFSQVDKVIFVGDYIDRGSQPLEVLEYVSSIPNSIRLMGNHEYKYKRKINKGNITYPIPLQESDFPKFKEMLLKTIGEQPISWYKDDNILVSHAPACLFQHNPYAIPFEKFIFGWTIPGSKNEEGFPIRIPLSEKYPGEVSEKPVIYGHVHSDKIVIRENEYVVDLCCGQPDGKLGAVIIENSTLVEQIVI